MARKLTNQGRFRTARERWGWGRVQEDGRVIGVRNNDGRAEDAAEIDIGRIFVRKKAQGWLPRPLMAGAGLGGQKVGAGDSQQKNACFLGEGGHLNRVAHVLAKREVQPRPRSEGGRLDLHVRAVIEGLDVGRRRRRGGRGRGRRRSRGLGRGRRGGHSPRLTPRIQRPGVSSYRTIKRY